MLSGPERMTYLNVLDSQQLTCQWHLSAYLATVLHKISCSGDSSLIVSGSRGL